MKRSLKKAICAAGSAAASIDAFQLLRLGRPGRPASLIDPRGHSPSNNGVGSLHCICINCARVTNCAAYHCVESKHEQPHITETPTFEPRDGSPTVHVNVRTIRSTADRQAEIERMWKEYKAEEERATSSLSDDGGKTFNGSANATQYDLTPQVTHEYDVVACADFVSDPGCWVRNMPDEIKRANPNFVPS